MEVSLSASEALERSCYVSRQSFISLTTAVCFLTTCTGCSVLCTEMLADMVSFQQNRQGGQIHFQNIFLGYSFSLFQLMYFWERTTRCSTSKPNCEPVERYHVVLQQHRASSCTREQQRLTAACCDILYTWATPSTQMPAAEKQFLRSLNQTYI